MKFGDSESHSTRRTLVSVAVSGDAADLESQLVAELETEPLHDAFFDRDLGALGAGRPPLAGDDLVRRIELLGPGQVRLAEEPATLRRACGGS